MGTISGHRPLATVDVALSHDSQSEACWERGWGKAWPTGLANGLATGRRSGMWQVGHRDSKCEAELCKSRGKGDTMTRVT